jgi:hypothetical protein
VAIIKRGSDFIQEILPISRKCGWPVPGYQIWDIKWRWLKELTVEDNRGAVWIQGNHDVGMVRALT